MKVYTKKEEKVAKHLAKAMVERVLEVGDDIFAHIVMGSSIADRDLGYLNVERTEKIEGFPGWMVFYVPKMEPEKFTPGYFGVKYVDNSNSTTELLELREYSKKIPKTILKSGANWPEFSRGLIDAVKKSFRDFKHEFDPLFSSEKLPNAHVGAIAEAKRSTTVRRTGYRLFTTTGLKLGRMGTLVPREEIGAFRKALGVKA